MPIRFPTTEDYRRSSVNTNGVPSDGNISIAYPTPTFPPPPMVASGGFVPPVWTSDHTIPFAPAPGVTVGQIADAFGVPREALGLVDELDEDDPELAEGCLRCA